MAELLVLKILTTVEVKELKIS